MRQIDVHFLPRYPIPVGRIGRLAVDVREQVGLYAVVVDAQHEAAAACYARCGFQRFTDRDLRLFLTLAVRRRALAA